jgi:hypothetical protein
MIYELRIYHCLPGRLPDVLNRFESIILPLFQKHGIQQAGFWTVAIGPSNNDLYYMLKWETLDDRRLKFATFQAEWNARFGATEVSLVTSVSNMILQPTSFSSVK